MWLFTLNAGAAVVFAVAGWLVGRCRKRVWLSVALAACVLALARAGLNFTADLVACAVPWIAYPLIENWHVPVVLLGLGALVRHLPRRSTRWLVGAVTGLIVVYGVWSAGMRFLVTFDDLTGAPDEAGLCRQTSNYSCGAASLCTVLAHVGVESTERECARLSVTQKHGGVSVLGLWRAARIKLRGRPYRASVRKPTWDDLAALQTPCAVSVRYNAVVDHFIVALWVDGDRVGIYNPLEPRPGIMARREFEADWRGDALIIEPIPGVRNRRGS